METPREPLALGKLLTVKEAAHLLHIHPNTVRLWSNRGLLTTYRLGSRGDRRFPEEEVLRLLNLNQVEGKNLRERIVEYLFPEARRVA